ncbi:MAG: hypothetical protein ACI80S_002006 [Pseudohongiellaceae bacterium]|jgi:hypothetical protein
MAILTAQLTYAFAIGITSTFLLTGSLANAESARIPLGQQGNASVIVKRPSAGMTKNQVQQYFGEPIGLKEAIGEPPISRWNYGIFMVYFEYDRVIHSVLVHKAI